MFAIHLTRFHMHIHRLGVQFPEDCLMNMFMATLEDNARSWYEGFPFASLCSLKYFHAVFCDNYKQHYPSLLLIENLCGKFEDLFQLIGIDMDDQDIMDDEIEEALFELSFH
jgi:hypothetical protein